MFASAVEMFAGAVVRAADAPAVHYFEQTLTWVELDALSDGLAVGLRARGVGRGDRVAIFMQNVPEFVLATLAIWKAGAIAVPLNPMYRRREVSELLADSGARVILVLESLVDQLPEVDVAITTAELMALARGGGRPEPVVLGPDDVAFLVYTSGTTGPPKGARVTHGNVVFNAQTYRDWIGLGAGDVVLGVAPLFHITGLIAHMAVAMLVPMPLVLC